ncbi:SAF domain-containing protein [Luteimicrobium sp. NPDC057192]|uniref:SAF domain-containing protein n=1 Tax=Luteimicrobium sp. NPDC057192 TaxID=3346042 RepID=UPI00363974A7
MPFRSRSTSAPHRPPPGGPAGLDGLRRRAARAFWRARFAVAALCCGLAATLVVGALRPAPPATVPVVVAARDVPAGSTLDAHDVRVARVAAALAPRTAYRASDDATGRTTSVALAAGTVVSPGLVAAGAVAASAPKGRVVVALPLDDDPAAALLGAGDHVDLLASTTDGATGADLADAGTDGAVAGAASSAADDAGAGTEDDAGARATTAPRTATSSYLAHGALVLPSPQQARDAGGGLLGGGSSSESPPTLVVAVTPKEAEAIAGRPDWARVTAVLVR